MSRRFPVKKKSNGLTRAVTAALELLEGRLLLSAYSVSNTNYSGTGSLGAAIAAATAADDAAAMINFSGIPANSTIQLNTTTVNANATADGYGPTGFYIGGTGTSITIDGSGAPGLVIDGGSAVRLFVVAGSDSLTLGNLTVSHGMAQGGDGSGGGAGLGGAVFDVGTFNADGCTFTNNEAIGGSGEDPGDNLVVGGAGGGGMGTDSGGGASGVGVAKGGGVNGGTGAGAGFGGGGSGGSFAKTGAPGANVNGGAGGFGGGGGGGGVKAGAPGAGGSGGFGGGGGAGAIVPSSSGPGQFGGDFPGGFGGGQGTGGPGGSGAGFGGGIFVYGGALTLNNDTLTGNSAMGGFSIGALEQQGEGFGGAIFNLNGTVTSTNSTIASNTANGNGGEFTGPGDTTGGAIYSLGENDIATQGLPHTTATVTLNNTILSGSNDGQGDLVTDFEQETSGRPSGSVSSSGSNNIIQTASGGSDDFAGTASNVDPLLAALAGNGGPTQTMALQSTSPAIDAGSNAAASGLTNDQRGPGFPRVVGSSVDIGAFEYSPSPEVSTNPVSQSIVAGQPVTFTAASSGNPTPTVQWQVSTNGGTTFSNVSGTTSTTFTFTTAAGENGNEYHAVFTNSHGTATTTAATLTVTSATLSAPVVSTNPLSQTIATGQSVTFTAAATGNPTPTVQWQVSTNGGTTFTNVSGATSPTLTFTTATGQSGNEYRAVFTNSKGTATTMEAKLTLSAALVTPVVSTNPVSQTIATGQPVTFTAAATGNPTPTVQWQVSSDGGMTFSNVSGATSATLTFTTATGENGNEYQAVFTNSQGTATTTAATLTLSAALAAPVVSTNPVSQTILTGQPVTFTAAASGNPTPTVQWQVSTNGGTTFTNVAGATSATLMFTTATGETGNEYRAVFTNSNGTTTTMAATLTLSVAMTAPVVSTNPVSQMIATGQPVTFTAGASGNPTPTVQWQVSSNGGTTFTNVSGATSATLTFTTATGESGNEYQAVFTNSQGTATSAEATLTLSAALVAPVVSTNPVSQTIAAGQPVTFTAAASGIPTPTVQWQVSSNGGTTFTNVAGAASATLTFTTATGESGNEYQAVFTNSQGIATTTAATLSIALASPLVSTNPISQTIVTGKPVTFTAAASGNPTPTVEWQLSTNGGTTFTNIAGATSPTLTFTTATGKSGNEYQAVFTNSQGTATTTAATLTLSSALGSVSGVVFDDANGSGVRVTGESNLSGFTIEAIQGGKVVASATSTSKGYQISGLPDGTYTITEVLQAGYTKTAPSSTYTITITNAIPTITGKNFGDEHKSVGTVTTAATIGNPVLPGSASYANGTYSISGSGTDISGITDQFEYAYSKVAGNTTISANVATISDTYIWAKAGVMIRASTAANSAFADVVVTSDRGVAFQWRSTTGAFVKSVTLSGYHAPQSVKLVRSGNVFTAYTLSNGKWLKIGSSQTIDISSDVLAGLAVTSVNPSEICDATFTDVSLTDGEKNTIAAQILK